MRTVCEGVGGLEGESAARRPDKAGAGRTCALPGSPRIRFDRPARLALLWFAIAEMQQLFHFGYNFALRIRHVDWKFPFNLLFHS